MGSEMCIRDRCLTGHKIPWGEAVDIAVEYGEHVVRRICEWKFEPRDSFLAHYPEILSEIRSFLIKEEKEMKKDKELIKEVEKLAERKRILREEEFRKVLSKLKEEDVNSAGSRSYKARMASMLGNVPLDIAKEYAEEADKNRKIGSLRSEVVKAILNRSNVYEWLLLTTKKLEDSNNLWKKAQQEMKRILNLQCKDEAKLTKLLRITPPFKGLPEKVLGQLANTAFLLQTLV